MVKIFDRYINIKNREEFEDCTEEMLEKLDQMLNEYGIAHAFTLAGADEIEAINSKDGLEYCVTLMYEEEDELTCELVFTLWARYYRKAPDTTIKKAMYKMSKGEVREYDY